MILWDQERVWIYTQDRPFTGERIYAPVRNPTTTSRTIAPASQLRAGWPIQRGEGRGCGPAIRSESF